MPRHAVGISSRFQGMQQLHVVVIRGGIQNASPRIAWPGLVGEDGVSGPLAQARSSWARVLTRSAVQRRTRSTAWTHRGHRVVLVLVVNSAVCDGRPPVLITENSWHRCRWGGLVPGRHRDHDVHKVRGFRRRENPWAGRCRGEARHTQVPSKSEEGLEILLSDTYFSMVHVAEDRQDVVVIDIQG